MRHFLAASVIALTALCAVLSGTASCTHAQGVAWTGAFKTCSKADLGALLPNGLSLLTDVAQKIEGNAVNLEADLAADAVLVGTDAVKCAIAATAAVLAPPPVGSAAPSTAALPPGLLRAQAWAARH